MSALRGQLRAARLPAPPAAADVARRRATAALVLGAVLPAVLAAVLAVGCAPAGAPVPHGVAASSAAAVATAPSALASAAASSAVAGGVVRAAYVGSDECATCHRPQYLAFASSAMGRQLLSNPRTALERRGCESCHGPGSAHVAAAGSGHQPGFLTFAPDDPTPVSERNDACLRCHAGTKRLDWQGSPHELRELACTNCHQVMTPASPEKQLRRATVLETCGQCHDRQMRAQQLAFSRMPVAEGKMGCTNCHNPHGSPNERMLNAPTANDVCFGCHAEKRGPFLWEHAPVTESCATCHDPHGSRHEKMLVVAKPRLCQQCHIESRHPTTAQNIDATRFVMGRQCTNCHFNIHGSNHPGGARFTR
jgi:DmsE family decaheme c-type cytochrome